MCFLVIFMISVNLGRKSTGRFSRSIGESSDIGPSWRPKNRIEDWKYVVLDFNEDSLGLPNLDYTSYAFPPSFRPSGFNSTQTLSGKAGGESVLEIPGVSGQFLAIW